MASRPLVVAIVSLLACVGAAETLVTEARILEVTERGFILKVGTEPLAVEDSPETRLWRAHARAGREAFKKDDSVGVRIKTDTDPPVLREMADASTWTWLTKVRKEPMKAIVERVESKSMHVRLADGKPFEFRISEKTDITLGGKQAGITDLTKGLSVYVKGRLLPTLDTWLEKVSDTPFPPKETAKKTAKPKPLAPLAQSGKLDGIIAGFIPSLKMFDLNAEGRILHITFRSDTKFFLNGKPSSAESLAKGMRGIVHYTRDKTGRILASRVELADPTGG